MANPYPQLRELGNPSSWNSAPQTPGAFGNNPMAGPHGVAPQPKWLNSLMGAAQGIGNAISAPSNALMGNYNQLAVAPDGSVSQFDPRMIGDATNLAGLVTLGAGAAPAEADALNMGIHAYHGSPHSFDKFSSANIGTGEGAQAYGHGLYFSGNEGVAQGYRDKLATAMSIAGNPVESEVGKDIFLRANGDKNKALSMLDQEFATNIPDYDNMRNPVYRDAKSFLENSNPGSMYAVDINADPSQMLDWDKPLSEQPQAAQTAIKQHLDAINADRADGPPLPIPATGGEAYDLLSSKLGNAGAAAALKNAGLQGIQYLDAGSRAAGTGTRNYVVFDDNLINILKKYGIAAPIAGGATAAASQQFQSQPPGNQLMAPQSPANPLLGQIGT